MQAIISDIIVNQSAQNGNLQVSQLIQDNSSLQTSFKDMLYAFNSQQADAPEKESTLETSYDDKKLQDISEPVNENKNQVAEKDEDNKDVLSAKDKQDQKQNVSASHDKSEKQVEDTGKKNPLAKEAGTVPKLLNNEKLETAQAKDSKKAEDNPKIKNLADKNKLQKNPDDKNLNAVNNEELADLTKAQENNAALQNALSNKVSKSEGNVEAKGLNKENALEIDSNVSLSANHDTFGHNKLSADEKVFALDKEGKIVVHDQRTVIADEDKPVEKSNSKGQVQLKLDNQNNATITMELAEQNVTENVLSLDNQTAASDGSNFQAMLSNQIQANAPEFVKAGSLVLQDNNKGTINLVLHPDDLGNVKIHLSMDGKTISAHITVNTKEALEVFKDNAQTLREAFAKNGYETANFDVSYNGNSNGGQNQNFEGRYDGNEYWARKVYSEYLGGEDDGYIQNVADSTLNSEYSINIVA